MYKFRFWSVVCVWVAVGLLGFASRASGQGNLQAKGYVNDFAGLMSSAEVDSLNQDLSRFQTQTTIEIAVVTVPSLEGRSAEDYTFDLFNKWGVGKKGTDNGVMLLLAPSEKKVRIEVGRGLEPVLTDLHSSRIIREDITPAYRAGRQGESIASGVHSIMRHLSRAQVPTAKADSIASVKADDSGSNALYKFNRKAIPFLGLLIFAIVLIIIVIRISLSLKERAIRRKNILGQLAVCRGLLDKAESNFDHYRTKLTQLLDESPWQIWLSLKQRFSNINFQAFERKLNTFERDFLGGRLTLTEAEAQIMTLQREMNEYFDITIDIEKKLLEFKEAKVFVRTRVSFLTERISDVEAIVNHPDVKEGSIRHALDTARADFQNLHIPTDPAAVIDWIDIRRELESIMEALEYVENEAEAAKANAVKARQEGPILLQNMPGILAAAGQRADTSLKKDLLAGARNCYDKAHGLAADSEVDWPLVFAMLLSAQETCNSIQPESLPVRSTHSSPDLDDEDDDYRPHNSYGGSSHDDHSIFGGDDNFGGFGGGSSGGGGATGDL